MNKTAARAFASVSIAGLLTAVVATVIGHIGLGPGYDPLKLTISDYALSNRGVTIEIAMVALAFGAPALIAGLRAVGVAIRGLPAFLLSIWSLGLLVAAIIPTDPPGLETMSTAALVHRYTSVAAFVALPIAAAVIASRFPGMGRRMVAAVRRLCIGCAVGVALLWYVAFPGGRVMMGLVERSLVGVEIAILMVLSIGILLAARTAGLATAAANSATTTATAKLATASATPMTAPTGHRDRTTVATAVDASHRHHDRDLVGAVSGDAGRGSRDA